MSEGQAQEQEDEYRPASEEVLSIVHAFSDPDRKASVRALAERVRRLEEDRDRWLTWAARHQDLQERAQEAVYKMGFEDGTNEARREAVKECAKICAEAAEYWKSQKWEHAGQLAAENCEYRIEKLLEKDEGGGM